MSALLRFTAGIYFYASAGHQHKIIGMKYLDRSLLSDAIMKVIHKLFRIVSPKWIEIQQTFQVRKPSTVLSDVYALWQIFTE